MSKRFIKRALVLTIAGIFITNMSLYPALAITTPTPALTSSAVTDAEIERERQLTKELALNIPDQTDDPTYPVTFTDPSKQGVDITVDDKTYTKIANPYLLPNLAMGEHKLMFKFKSKDGLGKVLTKKIVILPKAPIFDSTIKTAVVKPATMVVSGTALPQATVLLVVNSAKTYTVIVSPDGKWEFIIPEPQVGNNNIIAFTQKNGISSTPSKVISVNYSTTKSTDTSTTTTEDANPIMNTLKSVIDNIDTNRRENPGIFYGAIGIALVIILILLELGFRKKAAKKRDEKTIAALFGTLQKDGGTIIDAIKSVAGKDNKKAEIEETKVVEEKPKISPKVKKAFEALKEELSDEDETVDEQETIETTTKKTEDKPKKLKKVKSKKSKKEEVVEKEPTVQPTPQTPAVEEKTVEVPQTTEPAQTKQPEKKPLFAFFTKKQETATPEVKPQVEPPVQPVVEEVEEEEMSPEEPEKKVMTKEEFLKQFQKKNEE